MRELIDILENKHSHSTVYDLNKFTKRAFLIDFGRYYSVLDNTLHSLTHSLARSILALNYRKANFFLYLKCLLSKQKSNQSINLFTRRCVNLINCRGRKKM